MSINGRVLTANDKIERYAGMSINGRVLTANEITLPIDAFYRQGIQKAIKQAR